MENNLTNVDEMSPHVKPQKACKWSKITYVAQDETNDSLLSELPRECPSLESSDQQSQKKRGVLSNEFLPHLNSSVVVGVQPRRPS